MCSADGRLLFKDCIDVIHTRRGTKKQHGIKNGNKIFKKENQTY
jgi:hypothetical protein